ncbi:hypothetical protein QA640_31460 [Bradyrhizobium sp. CB82]|uniref:hypothetical protein n=1 Tax=Bradyrhizobium sp. CB82 TaxID=3039159 RepID=UPI0024B1AFEA|nr:hypothetical protein [Bradyrhizobium sp. CB82]WFU38888.1 hypothetical protein QA640_31460 [Bradyrhizobium sp. CB82]
MWSYPGMEKVVQQMRKKIDGVSKLFTLDACRHGGMTELEEAELTDGQGRALSGHKTAQAYRGYAKETMMRALAATRKRHAHLLAQKEFDQQNLIEQHHLETKCRPPQFRRLASDLKDRLRVSLNAAKGDGVLQLSIARDVNGSGRKLATRRQRSSAQFVF